MIKGVNFGKLNIDIQIGKNKINENFVNHLKKTFKTKEIIKIKMLQNFLIDEDLVGHKDKKKEIIQKLAKDTESNCVFFIGNTFCLYKKKIIVKKKLDDKYIPKQRVFNKYSKRKEENDKLKPRKTTRTVKPKVQYNNRKNF